ncbi:MAG: SIR2 family protein [Saprospiraceae bacterium]|nr:SIR2 family protein [Saprospiraceae bacterium]
MFCYFTFEDKEIDPLHKTLYLPKEHNIISWNYDNQLEIAFKEYNNGSVTGTINDKLHINKPYSDIRSHVYKVNGFCSMYNSANDVELSFKTQLDLLIKGSDVPQSSIYFAWDTTKPNYFGGINKIMERTNILVVIGYSFPNFNRDIDCDILDKLTILTCKEIVIQVPTKYEFKKIKDRIKQLNTFYK